MKAWRRTPLAAVAVALLAACGGEPDDPSRVASAPTPPDDPREELSGGGATVFDATRGAFAQPAPSLSPEREDAFFVGNAIFNRGWITAPASVPDMDGLGPLFNADNCSGCHAKDGRGRPPVKEGEAFLSMLLRLSVPGQDAQGGPRPEPTYGGQLQGRSILGVPAEGRARVEYDEVPGAFADGEPFSLRRPRYAIDELAYGPLAAGVMISPRVAPQMVGLGLLEAIAEGTLLAAADPNDADGDGISGRPNYVWDAAAGARAVGRFGWKANQPTVRQQVLGAFNGDLGITSSLFAQDDCTPAQGACVGAKNGGSPELAESFATDVVSYSATLAVPARRGWQDPVVVRGKWVFFEAGCSGCHTPLVETGELAGFPELSRQTIRPFTDLLLHDLGPELADGRPDFEASGSEWRTPPLWGVGLVGAVNKHTLFLHDGRARGLLEAVLWHGGEAETAKGRVLALPKPDRDALVAFLESL